MLRGYGTQFGIKPRVDAAQTARDALQFACSWSGNHAGNANITLSDELGKSTVVGDVSLKSEFRSVPGASWGSMEYRHPDPLDAEKILSTRARIAQAGSAIELQVEVLVGHRTRRVAPVIASAAQPGFVIDIVRHFDCYVGASPVDERATNIETNAVKPWVSQVLLDATRALPAILVTPDVDRTFPVDPDALAERAVAIANVYVLDDPNDTFALTGTVGKMLSCFHGGVRTYYPRLTLQDDPHKHPLYLGARLRSIPDPVGRVVGDLYALGSATIADTEVFLEAQRVVREHLTKSITATRDAQQLQALVLEKDGELAFRDETIAALRQELEDTKRAFGRYARGSQGDLKPTTEATESGAIRTVGELVTRLGPTFDHVTILPSAYKSSEGYGRKYHDQVKAALRCLDDLGAARDQGGGRLGQGVAEWVAKWQTLHPGQPLPEFKARESETTWSTERLKRQRTFMADGQAVPMQMHFTAGAGDWGDCVQIYLEYGSAIGKHGILVGYIGPHLDISSARS